MATDGITDAYFPSESSVLKEENWLKFWDKTLRLGDDQHNPPCPEIFEPQVSSKEKADSLLKWLNFWSVGNHDDRTILIVS
ncbi:MAG: hypothetical protein LBV23_08305 [Deltaproteobacteria bacterium]|nr:hypothetical protein [Deltaproteobacteria bacterium]